MGDKQTYRGEQITVLFDGQKCIHSRHCVLTLPQVFRANAKGPWIFPDAADPEAIAALAHNCPSGAITYERQDRDLQEGPPLVNTVRVLEQGPLAFRAALQIDGQSPMYRATLCRCGASKNKPFCDGSHQTVGFGATGEPPTRESQPLEGRDGVLEIAPLPNGPLMVNGNVEIISGTGRTVWRTQKVALCRCGASNNKPFCDGSHTKAGFSSD